MRSVITHRRGAMRLGGRRFDSVLGCLLLLSLAAGRAASGLVAAAAVSPCDTSSCSRHSQSCDTSLLPPDLSSSEVHILNFLKRHVSSNKTFHVQGWRWHTLSLARDLRRLGNLASRLMQDPTNNPEDKTLDKAVYHVIDFNMKALHRIENDLFFPWLREKLTSVDDPTLAESFEVVLDDVIKKQQVVSQLSSDVVRFCHYMYQMMYHLDLACSNSCMLCFRHSLIATTKRYCVQRHCYRLGTP